MTKNNFDNIHDGNFFIAVYVRKRCDLCPTRIRRSILRNYTKRVDSIEAHSLCMRACEFGAEITAFCQLCGLPILQKSVTEKSQH